MMKFDKHKLERLTDKKLNEYIKTTEQCINEANLLLFDNRFKHDRDKKICLATKEFCSELLKVYYDEREKRESYKDRLEEFANS